VQNPVAEGTPQGRAATGGAATAGWGIAGVAAAGSVIAVASVAGSGIVGRVDDRAAGDRWCGNNGDWGSLAHSLR